MYQNFDLATLEREYSPSSCIDDINVFIRAYIEQSQQALSKAQQQQSVLTGLSYGKSAEQVLDLFLPCKQLTARKKLQVYIHGGYWQELSKDESCFAATNFQQHGYHFAVLNYTLAPKASLSDIVAECQQAIIWLYQHAELYGYQKDEIYLSGSSAGGHLVMMMALTNWQQYAGLSSNIIKGICAVSGIYDLTPIEQTYINEALNLTTDEIQQNSPLLMPVDDSRLQHCQLTLAYGENETSEFKRHTNSMAALLQSLDLTVAVQEINDRNHFDVILDLAEPESWLSRQIFKQMK